MKYLDEKKGSYAAIAYSPDSRYLVSLNSLTYLRFWDLTSFRLALTVTLSGVTDRSTTLSLIGRYLVLGEGVWDIGSAWDHLAQPGSDKPVCPPVKLEDAPTLRTVLPLATAERVLVIEAYQG